MNTLYEIAREYKNEIIAGASVATVILGGAWALNKINNERYAEGEGFEQCSHVTGILSHTDYSKYDGDSATLKVHRFFLGKLPSRTEILDSDGDNECEKLTKSVCFVRSTYSRETEYLSKQHKFDRADYALRKEALRLAEKKQKHYERTGRRGI